MLGGSVPASAMCGYVSGVFSGYSGWHPALSPESPGIGSRFSVVLCRINVTENGRMNKGIPFKSHGNANFCIQVFVGADLRNVFIFYFILFDYFLTISNGSTV